MNNNRNSTYSPFTFGKLNGVSASSIGNYTEVEQDKSMLKGIEPLPLMKDGRRDNTVTIKKYYKEGYSKKEVESNKFQGTGIEGFESSGDKNLNEKYATGFLDAIDPVHRQRAMKNVGKIDIYENPPLAKEVDGKPITYLKRFKELTQAELRAQGENSQRLDILGRNIEAGQHTRGEGQNPNNIVLTKQTKQHRELNQKDLIRGFAGVKGHIHKPDYQESNSTRSNDTSYTGPLKLSKGGKGVYINESLKNYQEYNPEVAGYNEYMGPSSLQLRSIAQHGIQSVSRLEVELDHFGPAKNNKGVVSNYDDLPRGEDQAKETNYTGNFRSSQQGLHVLPKDQAKQTEREMVQEYFTSPQNQNAGLVQNPNNERLEQPYEHYTLNTGPGRFNKGVVTEMVDISNKEPFTQNNNLQSQVTRINDKSQETNHTGSVNQVRSGFLYKNNDELRETYGGQEQHIYNAPNNQDRGYVLKPESERLGEIVENLVPNVGPARNNKGIIHEITDNPRGHDQSNETNYSGGYRNSNFTYKTMDDELRETNVVLVEDYKGHSSANGLGESRDAFEDFTVNNYRQDITNRENMEIFGIKSNRGSSKDTFGSVTLNTLKENKGNIGAPKALYSSSPINLGNTRGKEQLHVRSNINPHLTNTLKGNHFINNIVHRSKK